MAWSLDRQQKNTLANREKKMSRERGKGNYKTPLHPTAWVFYKVLLFLQQWLMWKEVQENYSLFRKKVTFHSSCSSSIHILLHPCSDTCRCFWSVCSGRIPAHILAHHPPLHGWSFVSIWTQPAWGFFLLLLPLPHPETETSQRFSTTNCFLCRATLCYYGIGNTFPYSTEGMCLLHITFLYLNSIKVRILVGVQVNIWVTSKF